MSWLMPCAVGAEVEAWASLHVKNSPYGSYQSRNLRRVTLTLSSVSTLRNTNGLLCIYGTVRCPGGSSLSDVTYNFYRNPCDGWACYCCYLVLLQGGLARFEITERPKTAGGAVRGLCLWGVGSARLGALRTQSPGYGIGTM